MKLIFSGEYREILMFLAFLSSKKRIEETVTFKENATWWAFLFVNFRPSNLALFGFSLQTRPREKKEKKRR